MALPMSMSAGDSEKVSTKTFFGWQVEKLMLDQNKEETRTCVYEYYLENKQLHQYI